MYRVEYNGKNEIDLYTKVYNPYASIREIVNFLKKQPRSEYFILTSQINLIWSFLLLITLGKTIF
mgnify:CR=1 FL=1